MARIALIWEEKGEHFAEIQGRIKNSITITIQIMLSTSMRVHDLFFVLESLLTS